VRPRKTLNENNLVGPGHPGRISSNFALWQAAIVFGGYGMRQYVGHDGSIAAVDLPYQDRLSSPKFILIGEPSSTLNLNPSFLH
jgi:hypothetical protein